MLPRQILARVLGFALLGSGAGYGVVWLMKGEPKAEHAQRPVVVADQVNATDDPIGALLESTDKGEIVIAAPQPKAAPVSEPAKAVEPARAFGTVQWTTTPVRVEPQNQATAKRVAPKAADARTAGNPAPVIIQPAFTGQSYAHVEVLAGGILQAGSKILRIADINVLSVNGLCTDVRGVRWTCGKRARAAFDGMLRMKKVQCMELGAQGDEVLARCQADGQDVAEWLVQAGWASVTTGAGEQMQRLQREARITGAGQWTADSRPRIAEVTAGQPVKR